MEGGHIPSLTWMIGPIWQLSTHFWAPGQYALLTFLVDLPVRTWLLFPIVWLCNTMPLHNVYFSRCVLM